ncbi:MAG: CrcB family protein [Acidimicrobiales bacterium]|jgi:CrcB protein
MPTAGSGDQPRMPEAPRRVIAIAAGGALGTLARYGTDRALVASALGFPWATFAVNVAGSFVLGLIVTLVIERWPPTRFVRPFAAIGFCGGFTTFSTLMVESAQRVQHGRAGLAAAYLLISLVAGVAAAAVGMALARGRFLPWPGDHSLPDPDDIGSLAQRPGRHRAEP